MKIIGRRGFIGNILRGTAAVGTLGALEVILSGCEMPTSALPKTTTEPDSTEEIPPPPVNTPINYLMDIYKDGTKINIDVCFESKDNDATQFFYRLRPGDDTEHKGDFQNNFDTIQEIKLENGKSVKILKSISYDYKNKKSFEGSFTLDRDNDFVSGTRYNLNIDLTESIAKKLVNGSHIILEKKSTSNDYCNINKVYK